MFRKLAKILFGTIVGSVVFTVLYVGYFYFEGYMVCRSCLNSIAFYATSENCLAKEKVYDDNGNLSSVQDKIITTLKEYSDTYWYIDFETSDVDDCFGDSEDCTISCTYLNKYGDVVNALSYNQAAPKESVITITLTGTFSFPLRIVPRREGQDVYTLEIPLTISTSTVGTKYYKGTEDTFK